MLSLSICLLPRHLPRRPDKVIGQNLIQQHTKKLCLRQGYVIHQRKIESLLRNIRSRTGSPSERRKNPHHIPMSRMELSSVYNSVDYLVTLRNAQRDDRLKMLQNITSGQLTCIGEMVVGYIARLILCWLKM